MFRRRVLLPLIATLFACGKPAPSPPPSLGRMTAELRDGVAAFCSSRGSVAREDTLAVPPPYLVPDVAKRLSSAKLVALRCTDPSDNAEILFDAQTAEIYRVSVSTGKADQVEPWLARLSAAGVDTALVQDVRLVLLEDRDDYVRRVRGIEGATVGSYGLTISRRSVSLQVIPTDGSVDLSLVR